MRAARLSGLGWALFALSGVLFMIPALQNGDWWTVASGVAWIVGVVVFLIGLKSEAP